MWESMSSPFFNLNLIQILQSPGLLDWGSFFIKYCWYVSVPIAQEWAYYFNMKLVSDSFESQSFLN
ncbi:MAG: hypothetical protein V4548_09520, partial [Bacteroidota bacterium]